MIYRRRIFSFLLWIHKTWTLSLSPFLHLISIPVHRFHENRLVVTEDDEIRKVFKYVFLRFYYLEQCLSYGWNTISLGVIYIRAYCYFGEISGGGCGKLLLVHICFPKDKNPRTERILNKRCLFLKVLTSTISLIASILWMLHSYRCIFWLSDFDSRSGNMETISVRIMKIFISLYVWTTRGRKRVPSVAG